MLRREFLQRFGAVAGLALVEVSFAEWPFSAAASGPKLPAGDWIYDARSGVFKNPELTAAILKAKRIHVQGPTALSYREHQAAGHTEFGWSHAWPFPLTEARPSDFWRLSEPLTDSPITWASLELRASLPADLGRTRQVAWYGWGRLP